MESIIPDSQTDLRFWIQTIGEIIETSHLRANDDLRNARRM